MPDTRSIGWLRFCARFVRRPQFRHNVLHENARHRAGPPALPSAPLGKALVICHGNICRSPFAEHLLADRLPDWTVRSAGLHAGQDNPAEPGALRVARDYGLDLTDHRSTPMSDENVGWADIVIGMEGHHLVQIQRRYPQARARSFALGDFLSERPYTIEDPWGQGDDVFRENFSRIVRALDAFAASVNRGRGE